MSVERDPALPWGYWLRAVGDPYNAMLEDDDARRWGSVRDAFWCGRLGMSGGNAAEFNSNIELLNAVLTAIERRRISVSEATGDLFNGSSGYSQFYMKWLRSVGMVEPSENGWLDAALTPEGRAVLLMLAATRPHDLWALPVGPEAVASLARPKPTDDGIEKWFTDIAAFSAQIPFRFCREQLVGRAAITLTGDRLGDIMPISRTIWSQSFDHTEARDRFYRWLCVRLDRWAVWGQFAYSNGPAHLTQHFLKLLALELPSANSGDVAPAAALGLSDG